MLELARLAHIPVPHAVGIMEMLWHFTARYAIQGDIGRWTNQRIADAVHWTGDPDKLIEILVRVRWVDREKKNRLLIHDWKDHCDQSVRKTLINRGLKFISLPERFRKRDGNFPSDSGIIPSDSIPPKPFLSFPEPVPEPLPSQHTSASAEALRTWFDSSFWPEYPKRKEKAEAWDAVRRLQPSPELRERILASVREHKQSREWLEKGGQFIPWPKKFIRTRRWEDELGSINGGPDGRGADSQERAAEGEAEADKYARAEREADERDRRKLGDGNS